MRLVLSSRSSYFFRIFPAISSSRSNTNMSSSSTSMISKKDGDNNKIFYNFWRGHPNNNLLPIPEMQMILQMMSSPENQQQLMNSLQYLSSDRGDPILLKEISLFLERRTFDDEVPQQIIPTENVETGMDMFLTHGVSHGLDLLCTAQTKSGDIVLVERPTYFLGANIFKSHGLVIQSLPMKISNGGALMVDVDALEEGLDDGSTTVPRIIYIIPTHQNPTGNTMPLGDRWKLVNLARKFGFLVAADEVYHLLDWREKNKNNGDKDYLNRPARFSILDNILSQQSKSQINIKNVTTNSNKREPQGCCVSVSSFTKIFTPGVRCGWIEGSKDLIDSIVDVGYIQSQGGCVPFIGNVLRTALEVGLQDVILDKLNASYKDRCNVLCDILQEEPGILIHHRPVGGYFIWVEFLDLTKMDVDAKYQEGNHGNNSPASLFARYCFDGGLKFMPGVHCDSVLEDYTQSRQSKELCHYSARLCFADMDEHDVAGGAKLLIRLYREYTGKHDD